MLAKLRAAHEKALQEEQLSFASQSRAGTAHTLQPGLSGPALAATSHPLRRAVPIPQPIASIPESIPSSVPPIPSPAEPEPTHIPVPDPPPSVIYEESPLTSDFNKRKARIEELMFEHHTAAKLGEACPCATNGAVRTTVCRECWHLPASCPDCFVRHHVNNPTHWRLLVAEMHQRQMHGIDSHFPHRGAGNLMIFCPSCLEVGVNTRPEELAINDPKFR
jgi:hypothetical protein